MTALNVLISTYRIQLTSSFGFKDLRKIIGTLHALGIGAVYASSVFQARRGSTHGYDVTDHNRINPDLGTEEELYSLLDSVRELGMGWLQDFVPNHMAFNVQNPMLVDVLENGPNSRYVHFFDIDWDHQYESIRNRILAPFLGNFFAECLSNGELTLEYCEDGFSISYYHLVFPVNIDSYTSILALRLDILKNTLGKDNPDFAKLMGIIGVLYLLRGLPSGSISNERYDQIHFIKVLLWELFSQNPIIHEYINENLAIINKSAKSDAVPDLLEKLLQEQFYRMAFWKVATDEINYRRFFNINDLICLRTEDKSVFDRIHAKVFQLLKEKKISGMRIDHIDGLFDPTAYLEQLRREARDAYIVVEKILDADEEIPAFWPVQGTTGYDFLNVVNQLFCDSRSEQAFQRLYSKYTGLDLSFDELVTEKKRWISEKHLAGEVDNLARLFKNISSHLREGSDITQNSLRRTLRAVMASLPVYRTYLSKDHYRPEDWMHIRKTIAAAKSHNPDLQYELDFLEGLLVPDFADRCPEDARESWRHAVMRFQQFTGPVMAKGFEDTALYVYNRLVSLNEVGGFPQVFGIPVGSFHAYNERSLQAHPFSMKTTSTHDTKRGEDVRARINVLSEIPQEWERVLKRWTSLNKKHKQRVSGSFVPEANYEYFFYQTLLGTFPFQEEERTVWPDRIKAYMLKAVREAKMVTSWLKPNAEYEAALTAFIDAVLGEGESPFMASFIPFQRRIALYGIWNSLAQTLLKITVPGVPDFYQGTELWDLNLVDPDNRRPVDFERRVGILDELQAKEKDTAALIEELLVSREDGRIKIFVIQKALMARRKAPRLFLDGAYIPLKASGPLRNHVVAFARKKEDSWALAIVPRLLTRLIAPEQYPVGSDVWKDTRLLLPRNAHGTWQCAFSGQWHEFSRRVEVGTLLAGFPVALYLSMPSAAA